MAVEKKGAAPDFVLDPAWPQPLPNRWVMAAMSFFAARYQVSWLAQSA